MVSLLVWVVGLQGLRIPGLSPLTFLPTHLRAGGFLGWRIYLSLKCLSFVSCSSCLSPPWVGQRTSNFWTSLISYVGLASIMVQSQGLLRVSNHIGQPQPLHLLRRQSVACRQMRPFLPRAKWSLTARQLRNRRLCPATRYPSFPASQQEQWLKWPRT